MYNPFDEFGVHAIELFRLLEELGKPSMELSSGVVITGVDDDDDLGFVRMESGGRMLNIWSSAWGGPYESNGSGTVCNIGSMTGSELHCGVS